MWNFLYRNSRALVLFLSLIVVWGLLSLQALPRLEDPPLSQWNGVIITSYPTASAEQVETSVTTIIEQELATIQEIGDISSTSRSGSSVILVDLSGSVQNIDQAWGIVRDRLKDVAPKLPEGATTPQLEAIDLRAYSLVIGLSWNQDSPVNFTILNQLAEGLQANLRGIKGTEDVDYFAEPTQEILVEADASKLLSHGLSLQDLARQLSNSDVKTDVGKIDNNRNTLSLGIHSKSNSVEQIRLTSVQSGNNSQQTVIGDIASVSKGTQNPPSQRAYLNGRPGIAIAVRVEADFRIDMWIEDINQTLEEFRQSLPNGIELTTISDQSQYVTSRINGLFNSLIVGSLCVFLTTLFMLGWRTSLAVSITMPLTAFIVFGGMQMLSLSFNQISVMGLVMALGMLIDGAIVMGDELLKLFTAGLTPLQAIPTAIKILFIPLLASTLTTVISFIPIVILSGPVGEFVGSIGISIILALLVSLILSLTIVPALMGHLHPRTSLPGQPYPYHLGFSSYRLTRFYASILDASLTKPFFSIVLSLVVPISGFFLASTLEEQFFPPSERNQFHIELELPGSSSFQKTEALTLQLQDTLMKHAEIKQVNWFVGQYAPAFYYNLPRGGKNISNFSHAIVQTQNSDHNSELINALQVELDQSYPEAQILVRVLEQGPYIAAPLEVNISGPDLKQLRLIGDRIRSALTGIEGVTHTRSSLSEIAPQLALNINETQTRLLGLNDAQIAQQLSTNLDGVIGGSILEGSQEIPIRLKLASRDRNDIDDVENLNLLGQSNVINGARVKIPLSTVSELELQPKESTITRFNGTRVNTVQGFLTTDTLPSNAQKQLKNWIDLNLKLPPSYHLTFGGESEKRDSSVTNLLVVVAPLMLIMIAILVLSFRSFRGAAIIVIVGILSLGLGFFSLAIFNYPLGFMAILGMVSMVGMAINDSIVTLSALKEFPEHQRGDRLVIRNVILRNTRHILTTTLTTVAGFIPLFLDGGLFWPPLVVCIAGGVTGATALSIFFVPNLYLLMFRPRSLRLALPENRQIS